MHTKNILLYSLLLLFVSGGFNTLAQTSNAKITNTAYYKNPRTALPKGYVIFDSVGGDLNKDGLIDSVFIIKATKKEMHVINEHDKKVDRNRRGIMVFIKEKNQYKLHTINTSCFSSEKESGGVYFPPELMLRIAKGNLYIDYGHGRYGHWGYTFRIKNNDFELIGYDEANHHGPYLKNKTSINFLTKKKLEQENTNKDYDNDEVIFKDTWKKIVVKKTTWLSEIEDFDELELPFTELPD